MRTIYFTVDDNGFLEGYSSNSMLLENEICIELEETHELFSNPFSIFKYEDGEIIKDDEAEDNYIKEEIASDNKPTLKEENEILKKQLDETSKAVITLMDMQMKGDL